ncbi:MAG: DUF502 domain-containing protein [Candidatus Rokubacteria bacterium]|nr:DUF502 domain-containing protein [Candidatus Rokubacteria bacterium]
MSPKMQSWFKVRFITGFFVTVPVVLTAYVLWIFYREVDGLLSPVYEQLVGRRVPGLGFLTAVVIIFLVGVIATNVVGGRILQWAEGLLRRVPVFGRVYPAVKDLFEAFSPQRLSGFREFVIVEHPREGIYAYGFRTGEIRVEGTKPEVLVTVFVPTNHLYLGDIILVPREGIVSTGLSIEEGIRIILSAGTAAPRRITGSRRPEREAGSK